MSEKKLEMAQLDEAQLAALREQLKAAVGGQGDVVDGISAAASHISHNDSDGWA